jgi:hypothetical protein
MKLTQITHCLFCPTPLSPHYHFKNELICFNQKSHYNKNILIWCRPISNRNCVYIKIK